MQCRVGRWALVLVLAFGMKGSLMSAESRSWKFLAPLPAAIAGQCVGTVGDVLVVAGGSSWTAPPWSSGVKSWSAHVYALRSLEGKWETEAELPHALGYGASAQWDDSFLCIGGQDAAQVFDSVLRFHIASGKVVMEELPKLPKPLTNAAAAVVSGTLFVVGGQHGLAPNTVSREIWSLSLRGGKYGEWKMEPRSPWVHARILPVAIGCKDALFVMSGADLATAADGAPIRTYLKDAWKREAKGVWTQLEDLPVPVVAAPGTCNAVGHPIVFGGDDGVLAPQAQVLQDKHPGFGLDVHEIDPATGKWRATSRLPLSLVTTGAAKWKSHYVIAGGEPQPGHRSDKVIALPVGR